MNKLNKKFIGLKPHEVINVVTSDLQDIANKSLTDNDKDTLYNAYMTVQQYKGNELKTLLEVINDIKTSLYADNFKQFKVWDNASETIRGTVYAYEQQLIESYKVLQ